MKKNKKTLEFSIWARKIFEGRYSFLSGLSKGNCCARGKTARALSWSFGAAKKERENLELWVLLRRLKTGGLPVAGPWEKVQEQERNVPKHV
ncbi:MAG: hypothetical protein JSU70_08275 [Phycisphaerales bacterium]|nr:MAG: hypothetical protein JSU70_08275 [Phycisphaerales bacterium]